MKAKPGQEIFGRDPIPLPQDDILPALARRAVETFVREQVVIAPGYFTSDSILSFKFGCFVSIKNPHDLRGCIGTTEPTKNNLAEEIIINAIHAATHDPRFAPVSRVELPNLSYSVDVLDTPEPARFQDLDPVEFGVIVEDESGTRRGLLLPSIEGIDTPEQQVKIAARKANITSHTPLRLYRFRVCRFTETIT